MPNSETAWIAYSEQLGWYLHRGGSTGQPLALDELERIRTGDDHDVHVGRQPGRLRAERLPQQALDLVAIDRAADLARHGHAQARAVLRRGPPITRERVQHEVPAPVGSALAIDAFELRTARQAAALRPLRSGGARRHVLHGGGG
jgi:hypothetical protein